MILSKFSSLFWSSLLITFCRLRQYILNPSNYFSNVLSVNDINIMSPVFCAEHLKTTTQEPTTRPPESQSNSKCRANKKTKYIHYILWFHLFISSTIF